MIKLFWNTHNQKKTITDNKNIKDKEAVDFKWGIYHKENSDEWIYEILKKINYTIINNEKSLLHKKSDYHAWIRTRDLLL